MRQLSGSVGRAKKSARRRCQDLAAWRRAGLNMTAWSRRSYPFARPALAMKSTSPRCTTPRGARPIAGVIPGRELERMIARRGPAWWRLAIARRTPLIVLEFGGAVVGYVSYGKNRVPTLGFGGEIFELYLAPECQGCGLGRRMFEAARKDLAGHGYGLSSSGRWRKTTAPSASIAGSAGASCAARMRLSAGRTESGSLSALAERPIPL